MTDDPLPCGLGWLPSPEDGRDWGVDALYAATGTEAPVALPTAFHVPAPLYPVVDQGSGPMCVAYSAAGEQGWRQMTATWGAADTGVPGAGPRQRADLAPRAAPTMPSSYTSSRSNSSVAAYWRS